MNYLSKAGMGFVCGVIAINAFPVVPRAQADMPKITCYGASCRDLDPSETVCADDAFTLYSMEATTPAGSSSWGILEMRYSRTCHATWVRFTPWSGLRSWLQNLAGGAEVAGSPWVWREGVADAPRGYAGQSSILNPEVSYWTSMVDATGRTCMSVDVYETEFSQSGGPWDWEPRPSQGGRNDLGNYTAGCFD